MTDLIEPVVVLGLNCDLYYNSAGYSTPSWLAVPSVKDLKMVLQAGEADVSTRGGGGWEAVAQALKKGSLEFDLVWSKKADTNLLPADVQKFLDKYLSGGALELLAIDGPVATPGSQGLRAHFAILDFSRQESLAESVRASVVAKPTLSAHNPEWFVVPPS